MLPDPVYSSTFRRTKVRGTFLSFCRMNVKGTFWFLYYSMKSPLCTAVYSESSLLMLSDALLSSSCGSLPATTFSIMGNKMSLLTCFTDLIPGAKENPNSEIEDSALTVASALMSASSARDFKYGGYPLRRDHSLQVVSEFQ